MKDSRGEREKRVERGPAGDLGPPPPWLPGAARAQRAGITNMFSECRCHCECLKNKSVAQGNEKNGDVYDAVT